MPAEHVPIEYVVFRGSLCDADGSSGGHALGTGVQSASLNQPTFVCVWPGMVISMMPAQLQLHLEALSRAGKLPSFVFADAPALGGRRGGDARHRCQHSERRGCGGRHDGIGDGLAHAEGHDVFERNVVHDVGRRLIAAHHLVGGEDHKRAGGHSEAALERRAVDDFFCHGIAPFLIRAPTFVRSWNRRKRSDRPERPGRGRSPRRARRDPSENIRCRCQRSRRY